MNIGRLYPDNIKDGVLQYLKQHPNTKAAELHAWIHEEYKVLVQPKTCASWITYFRTTGTISHGTYDKQLHPKGVKEVAKRRRRTFYNLELKKTALQFLKDNPANAKNTNTTLAKGLRRYLWKKHQVHVNLGTCRSWATRFYLVHSIEDKDYRVYKKQNRAHAATIIPQEPPAEPQKTIVQLPDGQMERIFLNACRDRDLYRGLLEQKTKENAELQASIINIRTENMSLLEAKSRKTSLELDTQEIRKARDQG